jgi:DNA-binding protein H-NS
MSDLKAFDFSLFTDRQLIDLAIQVRNEVERRRQDRRALTRGGGLRDAAGPRYRNPGNQHETWTGEGKPPVWVRRALQSGASLEDLEIGRDDD